MHVLSGFLEHRQQYKVQTGNTYDDCFVYIFQSFTTKFIRPIKYIFCSFLVRCKDFLWKLSALGTDVQIIWFRFYGLDFMMWLYFLCTYQCNHIGSVMFNFYWFDEYFAISLTIKTFKKHRERKSQNEKNIIASIWNWVVVGWKGWNFAFQSIFLTISTPF